MPKSLAFAVISMALLAGCTTARDRRDLTPTANPSAVIATEIAFARAAQEKGQWTAFREYAAPDAVMFVPQRVSANDWLRRQTDPPQAVRWQPHRVWSSCDGSLAVTKGAWQRPDGTHGYFVTVWERQRDRSYRWTFDRGDVLDTPLAAPEFVQAEVADCAGAASTWNDPEPFIVQYGECSLDATLCWGMSIHPERGDLFRVSSWTGSQRVDVLEERFPPPPGG